MSGLPPEQRIRRALDSGRVKGEGPFLDGLNALDELVERLRLVEEALRRAEVVSEYLLAEVERLRGVEEALREEFFRILPDLDYETEEGWAWARHSWFGLLGLSESEVRAALDGGERERRELESHSDFTDSGGDPRPRLYP